MPVMLRIFRTKSTPLKNQWHTICTGQGVSGGVLFLFLLLGVLIHLFSLGKTFLWWRKIGSKNVKTEPSIISKLRMKQGGGK